QRPAGGQARRPVSDDRREKRSDTEAIQKGADECSAADHSAGGNRRAGVGESELENPDSKERDPGTFISRRRSLQKEPVITDESVAMTEHERESNGIEQEAT